MKNTFLRLFKALGLVELTQVDGSEYTLNWNRVVLAVILVKGILWPGWHSCVELALVLGFVAFRWTVEPKPVARVPKEQAEALAEEVKALRGEVSSVKIAFGFDPSRRFTMINLKRG